MSRTEVHKGKAIPLNMDVFDFLTKHKDLVQSDYKDCDDIYEVFYNGLTCGYEKYILIDDMVWELDNRELDPYGFSFAEKNPDGSFNYFVSFYNGGCCLQEAVQDAMGKST
jgi:hypothetical protein